MPAYIITQGLFSGHVRELSFVTNCTCECVFDGMTLFFRFVHHYYTFSLIYFGLFSLFLFFFGGVSLTARQFLVLYESVIY